LVTFGLETIKAIKTAAIEDGTASSEVMEAAAVQWLQQQKKNKRPGSLNG
jgi:hypothetical protein